MNSICIGEYARRLIGTKTRWCTAGVLFLYERYYLTLFMNFDGMLNFQAIAEMQELLEENAPTIWADYKKTCRDLDIVLSLDSTIAMLDSFRFRNSFDGLANDKKRDGNLKEASYIYEIMCCTEIILDRAYIWNWIQVMLLAKNFKDAELLLRYLYAFNVVINNYIILNGNMRDIENRLKSGRIVPLSFEEYNPRRWLRQVGEGSFETRQDAEMRLRRFGYSDYWNQHVQLSTNEYDEFCRVFPDKAIAIN